MLYRGRSVYGNVLGRHFAGVIGIEAKQTITARCYVTAQLLLQLAGNTAQKVDTTMRKVLCKTD